MADMPNMPPDGTDDDEARLIRVRRAIDRVLEFGQQNQLRGNLQMRAQLKQLMDLESQLMARINAAKGLQYNLAARRRNKYGDVGCRDGGRCACP